MPDGQEEQLDFSDIGGQRVGPPPAQEFDFSDLGGQRVGRADAQQSSGGFFGGFGDLGPLSVQNHPEWLSGWPAATTSVISAQPQSTGVSASANRQAEPLDFSDIGGQRVGKAGGQLPSGGFSTTLALWVCAPYKTLLIGLDSGLHQRQEYLILVT